MNRRMLLIVFTLLLTGVVQATEHRVATAAELTKVISKLAPGDTVIMADGEWRDQTLRFRGRGTAEKPITLRSATPGGAVLVGQSTLDIDGEWLVVSGLLVRDGTGPKEGIALRGQNNRLTESAMIGGTYKHFVRVFGVRNRVDHNYLAGKTSGEPTLQIESEASGPNHHRIDRNHFGPREPLGKNGGETIRVGYSGQSMNVSRTLVEQNLFDNCDGEIEIISSKSCENIYRHNTFFASGGMLTLRHGNRCLIDGNFFLGQRKKSSGGVRVIGEDHVIINNYIEGVERGGIWLTSGIPDSPLNAYFQVKRALIAFNTVVDSNGPALELDNGHGNRDRTLRPENVTVAHNIFVPGKRGEVIKGTEGEGFSWEGNFAGGVAREGFLDTDPLLERGADGLLVPIATSPVRGAAKGTTIPLRTDIDGQPRTGDFDAGCDQHSDAPIINRPLTAADVGPKWLEQR